MDRYYIDYQYGTGDENQWVDGTLKDAMKIAEHNAKLDGHNICIYSHKSFYSGNFKPSAILPWCGIRSHDMNKDEYFDIIKGFGNYYDWIILERNEND